MGVALAATAAWAVTLRKVEALARATDKSQASPSSSPPPPTSKKRGAAVGNPDLVAGSVGAAGADRRIEADEGLRRRDIRGKVIGDPSVANGRHAAAAANGNGNSIARKDL